MRRSVQVGMLGAAGLLIANLLAFAGDRYAAFAERRLDRPESDAAAQAAGYARRLTPWSSRHAALEGWIAAERRDATTALAAYRRALRLAPADGVLWAEYALALARLGRFDSTFEHALEHARRRAPASAAVRRTLAEMGVSYWNRGTAAAREVWLAALREELTRDRAGLLSRVVARGQAETFCGEPARVLEEHSWCAALAATRACLRSGEDACPGLP